jgi:hypothetical protein
MRKVNEHLKMKYKARVVLGLQHNLNQVKTKESQMRLACQFRLFRATYLKLNVAFKALKMYPALRRKRLIYKYKQITHMTNYRALQLIKVATIRSREERR